jgi:ribosomal protein S21
MLKRFKKQIANEGLMQELRTREYYKTPAERKREKRERNAKRLKK